MRENKHIIENFNKLHTLTKVAVQSYLNTNKSSFASMGRALHIILSGIKHEEELFSGADRIQRAEKINILIDDMGAQAPLALLGLLLVIFQVAAKGSSLQLMNLAAEQWIQGDHENGSLRSTVFAPEAVHAASEVKDNFSKISAEFNETCFDKCKAARSLLRQALDQFEIKDNVALIMDWSKRIRIIVDNPKLPMDLNILPKSSAIETHYAETSLETALEEPTQLPVDVLRHVSIFLSRRDIASGLSACNRKTAASTKETLLNSVPSYR